MKKNIFILGIGLAAGLFLFTSAKYKSMEEQTAAIDKMVQEKVDALVATKAAECEETAKRKAAMDAEKIISALPKKTVAPVAPVAPAKTTPKKPVKPAPAPKKPAPAKPTPPPVVKEAPKPAPPPAPNAGDIKIGKKGEATNNPPAPAEPKANTTDIKIGKKGGGK